jgi:hypothetical protein
LIFPDADPPTLVIGSSKVHVLPETTNEAADAAVLLYISAPEVNEMDLVVPLLRTMTPVVDSPPAVSSVQATTETFWLVPLKVKLHPPGIRSSLLQDRARNNRAKKDNLIWATEFNYQKKGLVALNK